MKSHCGCRLQRSVCAKAKLDARQQQVLKGISILQALQAPPLHQGSCVSAEMLRNQCRT